MTLQCVIQALGMNGKLRLTLTLQSLQPRQPVPAHSFPCTSKHAGKEAKHAEAKHL